MTSVFLSHNTNDKTFARRLAGRLSAAGLRVWIDEAEIKVGESLVYKISDGVCDSDFVVAVISTHSVHSSWVRWELSLAMTQEINGRFVKVLPILIETCELPAILQDKLYLNFTDEARFEEEVRRLLDAILSPVLPGSTYPATASTARPYPTESVAGLGVTLTASPQDSFALRAVTEGPKRAIHLVVISFLVMGFGFIFSSVMSLGFGALLCFNGFGFGISGVLIFISVSFYEKVFQRENILMAVDRIGSYFLPFGDKWRDLYAAGKHNHDYKIALVTEGISILILIGNAILLLACLVHIASVLMQSAQR